MTDYISRDEILDFLQVVPIDLGYREIDDVEQFVKQLPAADVVEMVHGEWIKDRLISTGGGTYGVYRCSVCKSGYQDVGYGFDYCPYCGAKMYSSAESSETRMNRVDGGADDD